jgi:hypothetical protein
MASTVGRQRFPTVSQKVRPRGILSWRRVVETGKSALDAAHPRLRDA